MKSVDKYVYPDTNILINKFDCRDEDKIREIEALSTGGNLAYLQLHPIKGNFDFKRGKDIHHFIRITCNKIGTEKNYDSKG